MLSAEQRRLRLHTVVDALAEAESGRQTSDHGSVSGARQAGVLAVLCSDTAPGPAACSVANRDSHRCPGTEIAHVLLTRRAAGLRRHAHEVSFPGGHVDAGDRSPYRTALREAHEEIGLDPASVRCVGALGSYATLASQTVIHPYAVVSESAPDVRVASPGEVEEVLAVSLAELLSEESWREEIWLFPDGERAMTFFEIPGDTIWGATAAMLRDLLTIATAPAVAAAGASRAACVPERDR